MCSLIMLDEGLEVPAVPACQCVRRTHHCQPVDMFSTPKVSFVSNTFLTSSHFSLLSPSLWVAKTCMRCLRGWVTASCLWPSILNWSQGRRAERSQRGLICWLYWRLWGDSTWETLLRLHWLLPLKVVLITDCSHPACQIDSKPLFSGLSCTFTNKVSFMPYLLSFLEDLVGQY